MESDPNTKMRTATCHCGQLRVTCAGEPVRVSMCHCFACQQRTGSSFGVQARFATSKITVAGRSSAFTRGSDSGRHVTFRFCPECGSTVYWALGEDAQFTAVAVGAFADPTFPPPKVSVYGDRRHVWVSTPDSVEEHWD